MDDYKRCHTLTWLRLQLAHPPLGFAVRGISKTRQLQSRTEEQAIRHGLQTLSRRGVPIYSRDAVLFKRRRSRPT